MTVNTGSNIQSWLKVCSRCGIAKSIDDFALRPTKLGLSPRRYCKECDISVQERQKILNAKKSDEEIQRLQQKNYHSKIFARYGITYEQMLEMGKAQGWMCYLCTADITDKPYIDHDHATGKVRKLLCFHCNIALGHFMDSTDVMSKAIDYINEHKEIE